MNYEIDILPHIRMLQEKLDLYNIPYLIVTQVDGETMEYAVSIPPKGMKSLFFKVTADGEVELLVVPEGDHAFLAQKIDEDNKRAVQAFLSDFASRTGKEEYGQNTQ